MNTLTIDTQPISSHRPHRPHRSHDTHNDRRVAPDALVSHLRLRLRRGYNLVSCGYSDTPALHLRFRCDCARINGFFLRMLRLRHHADDTPARLRPAAPLDCLHDHPGSDRTAR